MSDAGANRGLAEAVPAPADLADTAADIARSAGEMIVEGHRQRHKTREKGHAHNLVTEVDEAVEAFIVQQLERSFPDHAVIAEEGGSSAGTGTTWYVDPLDGTNNFAHGVPVFAVSLAAVDAEGPVAGVTLDPLRGELFKAVRGGGAFLNGQRLSVSDRRTLDRSLVATGFPYDKGSNPDNNLAEFVAVTPWVRGIRRLGSAALDLAYVAAGRFEAYWERGTRAWDVAAGILMVLEAGGHVTDLAGRPPTIDGGRFVASNGHIHPELVALLTAARSDAGVG